MRIIILLIICLTSCQPCLEQDPVYYYVKFEITDFKGADWYVSNNLYNPDSLKVVEVISGSVYNKTCKKTIENNRHIFDCDIEVNANSSRQKKFFLQLSRNDTDTLNVDIDVSTQREGGCRVAKVDELSLLFNNTILTKLTSTDTPSEWLLLKQKKYTVKLNKN